ncbi:response regulator [Pseudomonas sp. Bout1]|uniref:response regulator n=1 Tax=Pseudomonas sp. Bout1 TaxID=3048600 RepID=UPI002AB5353B|nr:response regulator [Pseudomonas sp. Bout1]MDY7536453.1 response regulator [Pseudomonas sp. Bout1]MEB0187483.1 response regulator [Pseudomonas sp. Bout1]
MHPRVLLIEDNEILRFLIADALSLIDAHVTECSTADDALLALALGKNASIDLVLTDIRMPGDLNGFELAKIIWTRWPQIPVILTSGDTRVSRDQLPAHSTFMVKPWTLDQLYQVIGERLQNVPSESS